MRAVTRTSPLGQGSGNCERAKTQGGSTSKIAKTRKSENAKYTESGRGSRNRERAKARGALTSKSTKTRTQRTMRNAFDELTVERVMLAYQPIVLSSQEMGKAHSVQRWSGPSYARRNATGPRLRAEPAEQELSPLWGRLLAAALELARRLPAPVAEGRDSEPTPADNSIAGAPPAARILGAAAKRRPASELRSTGMDSNTGNSTDRGDNSRGDNSRAVDKPGLPRRRSQWGFQCRSAPGLGPKTTNKPR